MNELITIPFHGDVLQAVQDQQGEIWVSLRRCCESLGVSHQGQQEKLKTKAWACVKEILSHDSTGRIQPATMLSVKTLPMWLATIDARKVDESVREKLALYQKEAADVLAKHFLKTDDPFTSSNDPYHKCLGLIAQLCVNVKSDNQSIRTEIAEVREIAEMALSRRQKRQGVGGHVVDGKNKEERILCLLTSHPEMADKKIAEQIPCTKTYVYMIRKKNGIESPKKIKSDKCESIAEVGSELKFCTLSGFLRLYDLYLTDSDYKTAAYKIGNTMRQQGRTPKRIANEKYGFINSYPMDILQSHFKEMIDAKTKAEADADYLLDDYHS